MKYKHFNASKCFHSYPYQFRSAEFLPRWESVERDILETGTYDLTFEELEYGVQLAWRNEPRCTARIQWGNLVSHSIIKYIYGSYFYFHKNNEMCIWLLLIVNLH